MSIQAAASKASPSQGGVAHGPLQPTLFHTSWWLNAASGGDYHEAEIRSNDRVVGRFPYVIKRYPSGHSLCTMPELTNFLGPAVDEGTGSLANRSLRRFQVTRELLSNMPKSSGFDHRLHRGTADALAFQDAGFTTTVEFTYEISATPEGEIWKGMRDKTRNVIRRAQEQLQVVRLDDPDRFVDFYNANLSTRGLVNYHSRMHQICAAAIEHGQGSILAAIDRTGTMTAGIFVVWDHQTAYYRLATRASESANGAISLLVWQAIRDAAAKGLLFDFDGLGTPGSRIFFTAFGGAVSPRYYVKHLSLSHQAAMRVWRGITPAVAKFDRIAAFTAKALSLSRKSDPIATMQSHRRPYPGPNALAASTQQEK